MSKLNELKTRRAEILDELKEILDLADSEKREISDEEETRYNALEVDLKEVDTKIEKEKRHQERRQLLEDRQEQLARPASEPPPIHGLSRSDDPGKFETFGDYLNSALFRHDDPRLQDLYHERAQSMGTGSEGGFAIPTQFVAQMLSVDPQEAIFRPRATTIPAGTPPDSEVSFPALDQGSTKNMYAGISFGWIAEGGTKPETDMAIKEITWKPQEIAGYVVATDKMLRNWPAFSGLLQNQFRLAKIGVEDDVFYNGDGVGKPLGILQCAARIDYTRATANQISYADVSGMLARSRMVGSAGKLWIASQTTIPQLTAITDAASRNIWVESAAAGMPPTLLGYPVMFSERSVALGTAGDLILADISQYYIKDGSGPFVAASEHVYFTSNKTVIKFFWNVDGHPWLNEPIPLEGSTSNTVSPFVVLA